MKFHRNHQRMKPIDIVAINEDVRKFVQERDWDQFHSLKNLAAALSVESSELLEIFQWLSENQSNAIADDPKRFQHLKEEVADVFIYLLRIIDKSGIDLEEAIKMKIKQNALKYPIEKSMGSVTKYTDLTN